MSKPDDDVLQKHSALILAASGDGIYGLDSQGFTIFSNPAAERLTGFSANELYGKPSHGLIHHSHADGSHYPRHDCPIYAAINDGHVHRVSHEVFWRKDGSSFPVEYVSTPMIDNGEIVGAVVAFRDVTEERRAKDALYESEERYRKIVEATHDAIFLLRAEDGMILDANDEASVMLGYEHHDLTAKTAADLHAHELTELAAMLEAVRNTGRSESHRLSIRASNGERIPVRISASLLQIKGENCVLAMAQDLRTAIEAERRTRKLQADLLHGSRLSAMGELASGMAHELNQPLTAVMNYLQACHLVFQSGGQNTEDKVLGYMDKAIEQAERAGKIISGLRSFVQKSDASRSFEDVNDIVAEASRLMLFGAAAEDVEFRIELADHLPQVLVDKIQIQQVVFNLVRNAVEALANSKNGQLTVSTTKDPDSDAVIVRVYDTGTGVDEALVETLFSAFTTTKADGMGVGLSICHSIVDDHCGKIWAERNDSGGMTFSFSLPPVQGTPEHV